MYLFVGKWQLRSNPVNPQLLFAVTAWRMLPRREGSFDDR
jgi:hypothetical protein